MKLPWFKSYGWIYYPVSFAGYLLTVLLVLFLIHIFVVVSMVSDSISGTIYGVFPFWIPAILLWFWFAEKSSKK